MASKESAEGVKKATELDVKREARRKLLSRIEQHVPEDLNVVPMMDMMTIILVFLLKSLSSSAGSIPQSDDLRLPHATVDTAPSNALQVIVSRVSITVNGRFIASLRNGLVDPSQKRGGGNGLIINPLSEVMRDQAQTARTIAERAGQRFQGDVAIIADHRTPSRTVFEVLYTCGQNQFSNFKLLVLKSRTT
ncbi:MAG: biopolymer transporter ExbD [Myxococcales bacterium]|nr:biopolymer transporter ExbD [Myxococcales bacterium]